ncbi:ABC transporter substrate-binding protein [Paenibacillus selenitireducens]|uniref:ABC transporter substrate-binding protein n=1 Tax=Paenibacillus selenitireducens TaxID=1324314 RepID=A0A1T2X3J6_9BACL|nr:ABC transporter substrate-binding protein [Paenibacillus selenitireducens]OPA74153.1 ABC transporter substrate-binding protein [Paenibacillus selenitireducens]
MQTILHFLELRLYFQDQSVHQSFPVTVEKLTLVWYCTPRYAKQIVRKLSDQGWIHWQPGQGRGHSSVLTFLTDSSDILLDEVKQKMEQGQVKEAMDWMNRFGNTHAKEQFMDWMSEGMGFSTQTVSNVPQDILRFPVYRTLFTLDPGLVYYAFDSHMAAQLFNTLVEYDHVSRTILPCIAHSWEHTPDGREWTFHLKKNVLFHHGRELTAQDVVYSIDRLRRNPKTYPSNWMYQDIEHIEAIDAKTVRFRLMYPNYLFLRFLCTISSSIVPEDIVSQKGADFAKHPVGTGPFRIERFDEGVCILEAFPGHFRGRPHLDRVEVFILSNMEAGRIREPDWTSVMSSDGDASHAQRDQILQTKEEWNDLETLFSCCSILVFNQLKAGPQNHPSFRRALHHILDRKQMILDLGDHLIHPAEGFRPTFSHASSSIDGDHALHPPEIIDLLHDSKYRGERLHFVTSTYHETEARWIQQRCQSYGIHMDITIRNEAPETADSPPSPPYDCRLFGFVLTNNEVSELELYAQQNYFLPAFDEEMARSVQDGMQSILREPDPTERQRKFTKLEGFLRDTHAVLFLVHKKNNTVYHKSVRGIHINTYGWLDFYRIWFPPQMEAVKSWGQ